MNEEQFVLLTEQVKRKNNITWDEDETNNRIKDIIEEAIPKIKNLIGLVDDKFDFSKPSEERSLLLNYCFYDYNNATNEFKANYIDDIMSLRHKYEAEAYKDEEI